MIISENLIKVFEKYYVKRNPYFPQYGKEDCWIWQGPIYETGYGRFEYNCEFILAHRLSYSIHKEEPNASLKVLHSCDFKRCINPDHLFEGTQSDNVRDAVEKNRHCHGETHGMATITEEDVINIRTRYTKGEKREVLAKEYNLADESINRICSGESWGHVGGPITKGRRMKIEYWEMNKIKEDYRLKKFTQKQLASIYGVSRSYITKIINEM